MSKLRTVLTAILVTGLALGVALATISGNKPTEATSIKPVAPVEESHQDRAVVPSPDEAAISKAQQEVNVAEIEKTRPVVTIPPPSSTKQRAPGDNCTTSASNR